MASRKEAAPAAGHNRPPPDIGLEVEAKLAELNARTQALLNGVSRVPAELDADTNGRAVSFTKQLKEHSKALDVSRKEAKEPHAAVAAEIDRRFGAQIAQLTAAAKTVEAKITAYASAVAAEQRRKREEAERKLREDAEKAKAEAERLASSRRKGDRERAAIAAEEARIAQADVDLAAEAATKTTLADDSRARGLHGGVASLTKVWEFRVTDRAAIAWDQIAEWIDEAALEKAIRGFIKAGGRTLPGVEIFETEKALVR